MKPIAWATMCSQRSLSSANHPFEGVARAREDRGSPKGAKGRFDPAVPFFWGVWGFSKNIPAAKALLTHLCQRSSVEQTVAASHGYDIPQFEKLHDFKTWETEEPPKGTIYNYPPRGDVQVVIPYSESPTKIANQIFVGDSE